MDIFTSMANDVFSSLTFSHDIPEAHSNMKVPMLDIACWRDQVPDCTRPSGYKQVVSHTFYEKPCVSQKVLEYASALTIKTKIITLTKEVLRRMRNTARREPVESRIMILDEFMIKLVNSAYPL